MMTELRVERHAIRPSDPYYSLIRDFCRASKNLYNQANYLVRQTFIKENIWLRYGKLDKLSKQNADYPDYRNMPTAQSAQQTLRMLDSSWKSFFKSVKDWKKHPEKYFGRPKLPKYLKKDGYYVLILTNQNCHVKDGLLQFPKVFKEFVMKPVFLSDERFISFQQVRFIPENDYITAELVYKIEVLDKKPDKERAHYQSVLKKTNNRNTSKRLDKIMSKRSRKINDYLHKASRHIIRYCILNDVSRIVIGKNKNWKQECELGMGAAKHKNNQNFVQIPFARFIEMLEYKAKEHGITTILTEESYTSGTSFIDNEKPVKKYYNKERRVHRGLFISNEGILINADINGAFQIMKKVISIKWDRGCVLHPFIVTAV